MKLLYVLFIFFDLLSINLFAGAQDPELNNLKRSTLPFLTDRSKNADTLFVNRLNDLAEGYFESFPDSTNYYARLAIDRAKKIGYKRGMADGYIQVASVNTLNSDYKIAGENLNAALQLYKQVKDELGISEAYMGIGRLEDFAGKYDNALRLFNRAITIRKALHNDSSEAESYAVMGITYDNKGDFSKALDCYFKSLKNNIKHNNELAAADNYLNIGIVMQHLHFYQKSLDYFNQALNLWLRLNDRQGISTAYINIGDLLIEKKDYKAAFNYLERALAMFKSLDDPEGISLTYYDLGLYHYYTHRPDSAIYYLNQALVLAKQHNLVHATGYANYGLALLYNLEKQHEKAYSYALQAQKLAKTLGSLNLKADATLQLSNALAGLKQFENAYKHHELYVLLTDSLERSESVQKLISYNMAIDFENNQKNAARIQRQKESSFEEKIAAQRRTNYVYIGVIIIITILLFVYNHARRKQLKVNALLEEKNREVLIQKTDIKDQADKLNELNILKDRLIAVLAHDLRAPLCTLKSMFSLMADKDLTTEEFLDMVPTVYGSLENTSDFLDTLLFWINSQVDDAEVTAKSFCLCDLVKLELAHLNDQFTLKNITPVNTVTSGHTVLADPGCIRIVIHNLLTNAIKFSKKGSKIEISAHFKNDETIIFSIKDYGLGMPPHQLNSLFKNIVTSNPGTMNEIGTGMGLVFCKDLVEKYNGTIWATSTLGNGTTLSFTLPADKATVKQELLHN